MTLSASFLCKCLLMPLLLLLKFAYSSDDDAFLHRVWYLLCSHAREIAFREGLLLRKSWACFVLFLVVFHIPSVEQGLDGVFFL